MIEEEQSTQTPIVKKSAFVTECENLANWARDESNRIIGEAGIDPSLKSYLTKAVSDHFEKIKIDENCNVGTLKTAELNQKLTAIYHTFRNQAVYNSTSYRNVGPEQDLLDEISQIVKMAATKVESNRISRSIAENQNPD